jgi:OOP family OmpA-OmpF porin
MNKFSVAIVAASALTVTTAATAEDWYVTPAVGIVFADKDDLDVGPSVYLSAGRQMSDKWNLELSAAYSELDVHNSGDYERIAINATGVYFPSERGADITPFALASIGAADVDFAGTSNLAPTIELGAGALINTAIDAFTLRGELRYRLDFHHGKDEFNDDTFYEWTALIGAQFALGGKDDPMPAAASDAPLVLPAITFPLDSAQLTRNARATLDEVAAVLNAHPDLVVSVVGHADDTGPSDYNYTLSMKRADAVVEYLVDAGVDAAQMSQKGIGEGRPVASNATDDGRQRNRRVEFQVN